MKRREMFWMLLPCLLFAGAGWFLARHAKSPTPVAVASTEPFRLQIKSIQKVPVTPHDVADGYDTKIHMLLGYSGKRPARWGEDGLGTFFSDARVPVKHGGKMVRLMDNALKEFKGHGISNGIYGFKKEHDAYQVGHRLRLRDVPKEHGELLLLSDWFLSLGGNFGYSSVGPSSFSFLRKSGMPHAGARLVVRRNSETIKMPLVSRDPQITLRKVVVRPLTAQEKKFEYVGYDTKVQFHVFYGGPLSQTKGVTLGVGDVGSVYLQDATGQKYIYNIMMASESDEPQTERRQIVPYYFNLQRVPKRNGKVTLHAELGIGDNWPLKVQATVRPVPKAKKAQP